MGNWWLIKFGKYIYQSLASTIWNLLFAQHGKNIKAKLKIVRKADTMATSADEKQTYSGCKLNILLYSYFSPMGKKLPKANMNRIRANNAHISRPESRPKKVSAI